MNSIPKITKAMAVEWAGSQKELAVRLGVTDSAVSQWADDNMPEGRLWQLRALGCPEVLEAAGD